MAGAVRDIDPVACRALWCAVVEAQFLLAVSPARSDRPFEIAAARCWFGSRDFFMCCALAGVDGATVLRVVRNQLQTAKAA